MTTGSAATSTATPTDLVLRLLDGAPRRDVLEQIVEMFEREGEDGESFESFVLQAHSDALEAFDARDLALRTVTVGTKICLRDSRRGRGARSSAQHGGGAGDGGGGDGDGDAGGDAAPAAPQPSSLARPYRVVQPRSHSAAVVCP